MPSRSEIAPKRHPSLPPVEIRAQKDVGFAKFLKKHSSPTHQRVTAGGRIVPMEKKAPPIFAIKEHKEKGFGTADHGPSETSLAKDELAAHTSRYEANLASPNIPHTAKTMMPSIETSKSWNNGLNNEQRSTLLPANGDLHYPGIITGPEPTQYPFILPNYPGMLMLQPEPQMINGMSSSLLAGMLPGAVQYPYAPSPWLYPHVAGLQISDHATILDPLAVYHQDLQELLAQQTALFEDLDHQLKLIDRHRAMSSLDPYLVEQRKMIVEQRADAKGQITAMKAKLDDKTGFAAYPPVSTTFTTSGLNVQAPAYVPNTFLPPASTAIKDETAPVQKVEGNASSTSSCPTVEKPKRKPLYIKPPPPLSPQHATRLTKSAPITEVSENYESKETDGWGVQIGSAPVSIKKEQSVLSNSLSGSDSEISPNVNGSFSNQIGNPFYDQDDHKSNQGRCFNSAESDVNASSPSWSENDDRQYPAGIETFYAQQLDALRKPTGIVTRVQMGEGTVIEVPGQNLQPPSPEKISSFEKRYWQSKPLQSLAGGNPKTEKAGDWVAHHAVSAIVGTSTTQEQNINIPASFCATSNEANAVAALHGLVHKTQAVTDAFTQTGDSLKERHRFAKPPEQMHLVGPSQAPTLSHSLASDGLNSVSQPQSAWREALNKKGHSSVFLERRHALAPFPPSIDGSRDASRIGAQKLLAKSQPPRSPTLIHKRVGDSIAWYGPYHREAQRLDMRYQVGSTATRPS